MNGDDSYQLANVETDWRKHVREEWDRRRYFEKPGSMRFPLSRLAFGEEEVLAAVDVLLDSRITMGAKVREFEVAFAKHVGARHAVMVNSGSSANLLAMTVLRESLQPGAKVLVPAVCWSTSVWPIMQVGLSPVFVDVDPTTLNMDVDDFRRKAEGAKAVMLVHVLGNAAPMNDVIEVVAEYDLALVEDTCEALGSIAFGGRHLGTFGRFGTYSFYFSHHITTGEGGMVVCDRDEDRDLLRSLRAHGWSRDMANHAQIAADHSDVDPRFLFVNRGFNVRPMEVAAAFGLVQLRGLKKRNEQRNTNRAKFIAALTTDARWSGQLSFPVASAGTEPAWFGFPCLLNEGISRKAYTDHLTANGVENRPIVSGNFLRQPAMKAANPELWPGAEAIHHRGFFIGLHDQPIADEELKTLVDILLGFDWRA